MSSSRVFCNGCAAEVENADGFCLLGHRLSALPPPPPPPPPAPPAPVMEDLADAVSQVFEEAEAKVAALTPQAAEAAKPLPSRYASSVERTWAELESAAAPSVDDPINTFAPPPRMDWGPNRSAFRLKLRRDRAEASV